MNFRIKKHIDYGQAIYIAGNISQLGQWNVSNALRMQWNQKDIWTVTLQLLPPFTNSIEYKYFISNWNEPQNQQILWQDGNHNRIISLKSKYSGLIIDDKWNMQKISLNLMIPQNQDLYNNYSVIGNHIQLGNWKKKINLTKKSKNSKKFTELDTDQDNWEDYNIYTYTFQIYRGRQKFRYYYIRQSGHFCQPQRHPGRIFLLGQQNSRRIDHFRTVFNLGKVEIYQRCNFRLLLFSKITQNLYLGAYPKSIEDIKKLKQEGINAIFSIQTQQDYNRHEVSKESYHQVCIQQKIQSVSYSIKDMDKQEFQQKAEGALEILKQWSLRNYKIYVHCSAGIYRSPQLIILHLISTQNYNFQKAIQLVTKKHPYANPNIQLLHNTSERIKLKKQNLIGEQLQIIKEQKQQLIFKDDDDFEQYQENCQDQIFQHH